MKPILISICLFLLFINNDVNAQKNSKELIVQTQNYCDHCEVCETCKSHIEKTLYQVKGVKFCSVNFWENKIRVVFNPKKTSENNVRTAISECGYDADKI